jgi:type II secretory pathway pseudopilin PulG
MNRLFASNTIVRLALLFTLIVGALLAAGLVGWQQVRREVAERAQAEVDRAVGAVLDHADADGAAFETSARTAVSALRARTARLGAPSLGPSDGQGAQTLRFGRHDAADQPGLLASVAASDSASANLYIFRRDRFAPLGPAPRADGGAAGVAPLEADSEAFESLRAGRPFTGPVETRDRRYFAHFEPMIDKQGQVIGAYGALHPLEHLDDIARELSSSPVFLHGFLGIINRRGEVVFRTANLDPDWLRRGIAGRSGHGANADDPLRRYQLLSTEAARRDLRILAGVADADLDVQTLRLTGAALSFVGVVILLALSLAWLQARRLTDALADAEQARAAAEAAGAALNSELEQAAKYVESLLPPRTLDGQVAADWLYQPSVGVGGDAFGYHWLDERHFAFYLLDVCGHGVGAALLERPTGLSSARRRRCWRR